ncbi:MAG TPA: GNAT family N-acetyltransferase [Gaiellaceae bacterium]
MVRDLESVEHAAYADAFRGSPELCEIAEIGGAVCLAMRRLPGRMFNRVLGLAALDDLDEIAAFYGDGEWWVSDSHELGRELEERGFARDYGWMKFSRGVGPREARSELAVVPVDAARAGDFGTVVAGGYLLPDWSESFAANVVGRPGWSCYVAYDGDRPAGAGALFVDGTVGWLGFGATLPEYRGRGAQSALLAARIEDARRQGCRTVVTETGELEDDRPSNSYRNILRAGFREAGVRPNYRAPAGEAA